VVDVTMTDEHNRPPPIEVLWFQSHTGGKRLHTRYGLNIVEHEHMGRSLDKPATVLEIA
jgi:hypothetical protein